MEIKDALKKVQGSKPKDNFMVIEIGYDTKFVMPYKDGLSFLAALSNAEQLQEPYNGKHCITEFNKETIRSKVLSYDEYIRLKVATLLEVSAQDIKDLQLIS